MSAIGMQEQLAQRIAAIERKHTTIGNQATRQRGNQEPEGCGGAKQEPTCFISNLRLGMTPAPSGILATGLEEIDAALGGGLRPGLHEWYGAYDAKIEDQRSKIECAEITKLPDYQITKSQRGDRPINRQFVPLCLLVHLAWRALEANPARWVIWIGKKCFPYPAVLIRDAGRDLRLLRRSLFVRADLPTDRVWAADLGIRCGLAGAVIADGTSLDMAATRRLQLSAKSQEAFVFLARPPQDLDRLSAAATRWMVRSEPRSSDRADSRIPEDFQNLVRPRELKFAARLGQLPDYQITKSPNPQWTLELLRCKGMQPSTSRPVWLVEWNRAANVIDLSTPLCDCFEDKARRHEATEPRRVQG